MKGIKTIKPISLFATFVLVSTIIAIILPPSLLSADTEKSIDYSFETITYSYGDGNNTHSYSFVYSDSLFLCDSTELNGDIAKMSVALATAAYNINHINSLLNKMNFTTVNNQKATYDYVEDMRLGYDDLDKVAFTIATKEIGDCLVYIVPIKGTGENSEWYSDFNLGDKNNPYHVGFWKAAKEVYTELTGFLDSDDYDKDHTIVLVTGHSRGAAVSNLVGGWLNTAV